MTHPGDTNRNRNSSGADAARNDAFAGADYPGSDYTGTDYTDSNYPSDDAYHQYSYDYDSQYNEDYEGDNFANDEYSRDDYESDTPSQDSSKRYELVSWILMVALGVLAVFASIVMLFVDSDGWKKTAALAALWAAVIAIVLVTRYRSQVKDQEEQLAAIEKRHQAELDRELAAHREQELILEQNYRDSLEEQNDSTIAALRAEIEALRDQLTDMMGAAYDDQRVALHAHAHRLQELDSAESKDARAKEARHEARDDSLRGTKPQGENQKVFRPSTKQDPKTLETPVGSHRRKDDASAPSFADRISNQSKDQNKDQNKESQKPQGKTQDTRQDQAQEKTQAQAKPQEKAPERRGRRRAEDRQGGLTVAELLAQMKADNK